MAEDIRLVLAEELAHCVVSGIDVSEIELQVGKELWHELQIYNTKKLDKIVIYFTPISCNPALDPKEIRTVLRVK